VSDAVRVARHIVEPVPRRSAHPRVTAVVKVVEEYPVSIDGGCVRALRMAESPSLPLAPGSRVTMVHP